MGKGVKKELEITKQQTFFMHRLDLTVNDRQVMSIEKIAICNLRVSAFDFVCFSQPQTFMFTVDIFLEGREGKEL